MFQTPSQKTVSTYLCSLQFSMQLNTRNPNDFVAKMLTVVLTFMNMNHRCDAYEKVSVHETCRTV